MPDTNTTPPTRRAYVASNNTAAISAYLPDNYRVIGVASLDDESNGRPGLLIEGHDHAGWTLDGYVLPRLASGLYFGKEIPQS